MGPGEPARSHRNLIDDAPRDLLLSPVVKPGRPGIGVAGRMLDIFQCTDTLHLKRAAIPPQPLRLQSPLRHCWDWPGGAGNVVNSQELPHAQAPVRSSPPVPEAAQPSRTSSIAAISKNSLASSNGCVLALFSVGLPRQAQEARRVKGGSTERTGMGLTVATMLRFQVPPGEVGRAAYP